MIACPGCQSDAALATEEMIPGLALVTIEDTGELVHEGETQVLWDGQETQTDRLTSQTRVYCRNCSSHLLLRLNAHGASLVQAL